MPQEDTEFDQMPIEEALQPIESTVNGLEPGTFLSTDEITALRDRIAELSNRLGNLQGDEEDVDTGVADRLEAMRTRLDEIVFDQTS